MSIKRNFLYNTILTTSNFVFPFFTFPYVSRVLGVQNLGKCNFVDSIINYFLLFASLGISVVGIREIAKSNKKDKSIIFSSIFLINIVSTILIIIFYFLCIYLIPKFSNYKTLLFIGFNKIIATLFLIEWFYTGIENFKFITTRTIIIKFLYVVLVFIFIKKSTDYQLYFLLTVLTTVFNGLFNILYSRKFINIDFKRIKIKQYIKPILIIGLYGILTNMYTSFNIIYLGFVSNDKEVGFYSTATRIYSILLTIFTAFTTVMLPRMSELVSKNDVETISQLIKKSFHLLFSVSFALMFTFIVLAQPIIFIIAGHGYEGAIIPMQIVMPLLLVIGMAQILVIQILIPFNNDKYILWNSIIGAVVGIILNIILVPYLKSTGSAIVLLLSELCVLASAAYYVKKDINIHIPFKILFTELLWSIPYIIICKACMYFFKNNWEIVLISACISSIYFFYVQIIFLKNPLLINFLRIKKNA